MKEQWEQRYAQPIYQYGVEPNVFFREQLALLPFSTGKLLLPGEGEGRNAVYAAAQGWDVTAWDFSSEAQRKALRLAKEKKVNISYQIVDLTEEMPETENFDLIGLFFLHLPSSVRTSVFDKLKRKLKLRGFLLMEVFSIDQLPLTTGGPKTLELLYSIDDIQRHFHDLRIIYLQQEKVMLNEGPLHQGLSEVIRLVAYK